MMNLKTLRLLFTFYKGFFLPSFVITLSCVWFVFKVGISVITTAAWFKVITLGIITWYISGYKRNEFFYYQNLGLSKTFLWSYTLTFDFMLFILGLILFPGK